jgi:hypothetical protein
LKVDYLKPHYLLLITAIKTNYTTFWLVGMYIFISFQAAVTAMHQLDFHHEFITLRMQTLQIHSFLLSICASIRSCPPSAVAKSIVMATKQDTYIHSRQVIQVIIHTSYPAGGFHWVSRDSRCCQRQLQALIRAKKLN